MGSKLEQVREYADQIGILDLGAIDLGSAIDWYLFHLNVVHAHAANHDYQSDTDKFQGVRIQRCYTRAAQASMFTIFVQMNCESWSDNLHFA